MTTAPFRTIGAERIPENYFASRGTCCTQHVHAPAVLFRVSSPPRSRREMPGSACRKKARTKGACVMTARTFGASSRVTRRVRDFSIPRPLRETCLSREKTDGRDGEREEAYLKNCIFSVEGEKRISNLAALGVFERKRARSSEKGKRSATRCVTQNFKKKKNLKDR